MTVNLQVIKKINTTKSLCLCICCNSKYICNHYDAIKSKIGDQCSNCKSRITKLTNPDQVSLNNLLDYNPLTGALTHKWATVHKLKGECATYNHNEGYLSILIGNKEYLAHRIIWMMQTGEWPIQIDHQDHNRSNNIWSNLLNVSSRINQLNTSIKRNNSSGHNGIRILPSGKFCAFIMVNRKQISLGSYDLIEDAIEARRKANINYGFHENHGK